MAAMHTPPIEEKLKSIFVDGSDMNLETMDRFIRTEAELWGGACGPGCQDHRRSVMLGLTLSEPSVRSSSRDVLLLIQGAESRSAPFRTHAGNAGRAASNLLALNGRLLMARWSRGAGAALVAAAGALRVRRHAEDFPTRTVKIVVPFAAGGSAEVVPRIVADWLSAQVGGQAVIVENRTGAAGATSALMRVAKADPDGYTLPRRRRRRW